MISRDYFSKFEPGIFNPIIEGLMNVDYYCLFADFEAYLKTQQEVNDVYKNQAEWNRRAQYNITRMGKFSSDRSIKDYVDKIWQVKPLSIKIDN